MKGKILFVAGAAVGYVLGARAGRGAYVKIKSRAEDLWENPTVQKSVHQAEDFVKENAPVVGKKLSGAASDAAAKAKQVAGKAGDAAADLADKADDVADEAKAKAGEVADAAKDKAAQAQDKADDVADQAKGKADKAARKAGGSSKGTDTLPGVNVGG